MAFAALSVGAPAHLVGASEPDRSSRPVAPLSEGSPWTPVIQLLQAPTSSVALGDSRADGLAALLRNEPTVALALLPEATEVRVYRAMAWARKGQWGPARAELREGAREQDPACSFLVALDEARHGRSEAADRWLAASMSGADPLGERFAPDPAHALVRHWAKLHPLSESEREALFDAWWHSGRSRAPRGVKASDGFRLRQAFAWKEVDRHRRARKQVRVQPDDPLAWTLLAREALQDGRLEDARRMLDRLPEAPVELEVQWADAQGDSDAVVAWMERMPAEQRSDRGLAAWARALVQLRRWDAAEAVLGTLMARQPLEVDPFRIWVRLERGRGRDPRLHEVRSRAFRRSRAQAAEEVKARVSVLRTVERNRDGLTFAARRQSEVRFGLPLDLALAIRSAPGPARAARQRILGVCQGGLDRFLRRRTPWETATLALSPYGKPVSVQKRLPAADPARCGGLAESLQVSPLRP